MFNRIVAQVGAAIDTRCKRLLLTFCIDIFICIFISREKAEGAEYYE